MTYNRTRVVLSLIPDGELKNTFIHFAEQHNALVDGANEMKQDLDQISGKTPEAKAEMHRALEMIRRLAHYLHGQRFSVMLLTAQAYLLSKVLSQFGIQAGQVGQLFDLLLQILQKLS